MTFNVCGIRIGVAGPVHFAGSERAVTVQVRSGRSPALAAPSRVVPTEPAVHGVHRRACSRTDPHGLRVGIHEPRACLGIVRVNGDREVGARRTVAVEIHVSKDLGVAGTSAGLVRHDGPPQGGQGGLVAAVGANEEQRKPQTWGHDRTTHRHHGFGSRFTYTSIT